MNEVEKMYENANVEREFAYLECHRGRSSICCPIEEYEKDDECMGCINSSAMKKVYEYPPFTAEKQLLLLQLLARIESADYFQFFFYEIKQEWVFRLNMLTELSCESAYIYESRNKNFDECIAGLINIIWQDLSPEEKQQVKGILE